MERLTAESGQTGIISHPQRIVSKGWCIKVPPGTVTIGHRPSRPSLPLRPLLTSACNRETLCGVDRDVSKQELDLIQSAAGQVAQPRATASRMPMPVEAMQVC